MYNQDAGYCPECDCYEEDECGCVECDGDSVTGLSGLIAANAVAPIISYQQAMAEYQSVQNGPFNILTESELPKNHQTVVFVAGNKLSSNRFRERAIRFATSLNTNLTIKADVLTIIPEGFTTGLRFTEDPVTINHDKLEKLVVKRGWAMSMVLQEGAL